jgi:hypothetical protein
MDTRIVEKRLLSRQMARKSSMYFRMGDLPTAQSFFTVLREVMEELHALEAQAEAEKRQRDRMLAPRKPWFERP